MRRAASRSRQTGQCGPRPHRPEGHYGDGLDRRDHDIRPQNAATAMAMATSSRAHKVASDASKILVAISRTILGEMLWIMAEWGMVFDAMEQSELPAMRSQTPPTPPPKTGRRGAWRSNRPYRGGPTTAPSRALRSTRISGSRISRKPAAQSSREGDFPCIYVHPSARVGPRNPPEGPRCLRLFDRCSRARSASKTTPSASNPPPSSCDSIRSNVRPFMHLRAAVSGCDWLTLTRDSSVKKPCALVH
jgi:hypothetical protein